MAKKKKYYGKWGKANSKGAYNRKKKRAENKYLINSAVKNNKRKKKKKKIIKMIRKNGTGCVHIWEEHSSDTKCKLFSCRNGIRANWETTDRMFLSNERCNHCYTT